jgi:hypothetical protein
MIPYFPSPPCTHKLKAGIANYKLFEIHCQIFNILERTRHFPMLNKYRPLSGIAVCLIYNPPDRSAQELRDLDEYLIDTTDRLRNKYPDLELLFLEILTTLIYII